MLSRPLRVAILAVIVAALALVGCSDDDSGATPDAEKATTTTVPFLERTTFPIDYPSTNTNLVIVYHGVQTVRGSCDLVAETIYHQTFLVCPAGEPVPGNSAPG